MRVTGCSQVRLDERTDVREVIDPDCGPDECDELTARLADGTATATPGLRGWGTRTHTIKVDDPEIGVSYYHAEVEDQL